MKKICISLVLVIVTSISIAAEKFSDIDIDNDGYITIIESTPVGIFESDIENVDMDGDKKINPNEYDMLKMNMSDQMHNQMTQ